MRTLRWAAELAVSGDGARAKLGIAQLAALGASDMLDADQRLFVDAALESVYGDAAAAASPGSDSEPSNVTDDEETEVDGEAN